MKIVATFADDPYAGSVRTALGIARELERRGHDLVDEDGWEDADIVLAHLDYPAGLIRKARRNLTPIAALVRDPAELRRINPSYIALAVFPSRAAKAQAKQFPSPTIVVRPPIYVSEYLNESPAQPRRYNTIVGLSAMHGTSLFYEIVRRSPDRDFLAVPGTGATIPPRPLRNLVTLPAGQWMPDVLARTRVMLMPGEHTYGRAAVEAACARIPTIAHPSAAAVEVMGQAGAIWARRERVHEWLAALDSLDDPGRYRAAAAAAFNRAIRLDPTDDIARLDKALARVAAAPEWRNRTYWTGR